MSKPLRLMLDLAYNVAEYLVFFPRYSWRELRRRDAP